jgi:tetratricopeptide (TPR) repeat protein/predicted Ser/Thr protein kinase
MTAVPEESTPSPDEAGSPVPERPPSKTPRTDRDLIAAAMEQAVSPASDGVMFPGDLPPPNTFPGYELVREVHRGGQGAVYLAIQLATKRRVAIKLMHGGPFRGSAGKARFEREVQVLGQLNHPNIVRIHDSGTTTDGSNFYVMDYISGRTLDEFITGEKRPPIEEALRLFGKICEAINAAHLKGIIHRDIKPSNIRINASGEPIIVDFGLAKIAVPDVTGDESPQLMTMTGQFIGSLPWASPEQAEGVHEKVDVRTDVYSLGVVLYQMLTGKFPYDVIGNMRDVLDNILRVEPARPSTIRRQINDEVETIVLKCLAKQRERRYQSAGELGRDIGRYLTGQPIEAKRDSVWYVVTKTARRFWVPTAAVLCSAAALAVFALVMSVMYRQKADAERRVTALLAETSEAKERAETALSEATESRRRLDRAVEAALAQARDSIFDLHDQVENLVGATPVRVKLLRAGEKYVAGLKERVSEGPEVRRELASAQERLAQIMGAMYLRKVGTADESEQLMEQARNLREQLAAEQPDSLESKADLGKSAQTSASQSRARRKAAEAKPEYERAIGLFDEVLGVMKPQDPMRRSIEERRASCLFGLADTMWLMSEEAGDEGEAQGLMDQARRYFEASEAYWRARWSKDPTDAKAAREIGRNQDEYARSRITLSVQYRRAQKFDRAAALLQEARESASSSEKRFAALLVERPQSAELRRDVFLAKHNQGWALQEEASVVEATAGADKAESPEVMARRRALLDVAFARFTEAAAIAESLATSDLDNLEAQRDRAVIHNKLGNIRREFGQLGDAGQLESAREHFARSLEVRRSLMVSDPMQLHVRDLGVGLIKAGEIAQELAKGAPAGDARLGLLRDAVGFYTDGNERLRSLVAEQVMSASAPSFKQVDEAIAECRRLLGAGGDR